MERTSILEMEETGGTTVRVVETRRKVEKMAVDENAQASGMIRSMAEKAKGGWDRMKKMLEGKRLVWKGSSGKMVAVTKDVDTKKAEERVVDLEDEMDGGTVELVGEEGEEEMEVSDGGSASGRETKEGWEDMGFLDSIETEERDIDLEEKMGEGRKRQRGEDGPKGRKPGLKGLPGWDRKSSAVKGSDRWKRKVVRKVETGEGRTEKEEVLEYIPLPETFDLGLEEKGLEMNNSGRLKNNFGRNKEALFAEGPGRKNETRNWLASFTKAGCVACRDETGKLNHKGRDGQPSVLIVGDEATPSTVGYTGKDRNNGTGDSCAWILKIEHLGLEEVSRVLQKINTDKRAADKEAGKREHDFFLANGSKILVSSFVHLKREGIEGFISDFNVMVKKVQGVVGRAEIEILPVVPVVRDGVDKLGRELVSMVREWVEWIGVVSERESVRRLSGTSGREFEKESEEKIFTWKPSVQGVWGLCGLWRERGWKQW
jgi:hypothetical protein